ncbi:circadian clock KaiB family protein [Legionella quateirensis]|uniref:KaiB-like protein 2 n=1 Tax=Legionella quateirensis TaxID=45072 RepID=A0A378KZC4_9GAMM|nr:circadian clock KaiB family protein [Legionella quateirensis]KTD46270.1 KaiB-like protein 2 [Legionella quateirensis]STY18961.1 KaiB-like protein 2 [Legionella quateirensis]
MSKKITKMPVTSTKKSSRTSKKEWQFILYIAGETPHCMLTLANLKNFCNLYLPEQYKIDVIDLRLCPERAQSEEIIAIPTIIKLQPDPKRYIIGDFSNHELMLMKLGISTSITMEKK